MNRFAYGTTKAAVIGLTKSLAADLVGRKVKILSSSSSSLGPDLGGSSG